MFNLQPTERTAIFIDGSNLYATSRSLGADIDYAKLRRFFVEQCDLIRIFYYTAIHDDGRPDPLRKVVDWLSYNGYALCMKPVKLQYDTKGRERVKGNMDMEIAIDMMQMAPKLQHVILFSGDGDFRRLVDVVQYEGCKVTVVSTIRNVAPELRQQTDFYVDMIDFLPFIRRVYTEDFIRNPQETTTANQDEPRNQGNVLTSTNQS